MSVPLLALASRKVRVGAVAVLALDVVALGAFSVRVHDVTTTTQSRPTAATIQAAPGPVPSAAALPSAVPAAESLGSGAATLANAVQSLGTSATPTPTPSPTASATPSASPAPSASSSGAAAPLGGADADRAIAPCPVKLSDTTIDGGLQSLVSFAPAFGSFTPEAFAAAAAYQPALELLGPILAQYPALQPVIGTQADAFVQTLGQVTNLLGSLVQPLYGPYKNQVVTAETQLAAQLAPYSESLAYSSLGGCVVELESALVEQAQARTTQAQPAADVTTAP